MNTIVGGSVIVLAASLLLSATGHAATQMVLGKKFQIKDPVAGDPSKRRVSGSGQERGSTNTIAGDPTASGATLEVIASGGADSDQTFDLPSSGWSRVSSLGFKWSNRDQPLNPVKRATIKRTPSGTFQIRIDINAHAGAVGVVPPNPGTSGGFILTITGGDTYCVGFGGSAGGVVLKNDAGQWAVKSPVAGACPAPEGTTTTTSPSSTTTVTTTTMGTTTTTTSTTTSQPTTTTTSTTTSSTSTTTSSTSTTTTSTSTTTSTTATTLPQCGLTLPPQCGGACPAGSVCGSVGVSPCQCIPRAWAAFGPSPMNDPVLASVNWSGRVSHIAVDPADADHWLVGASNGGIWETADGGTSWAPRTDDQPSLAMGVIAFAPSNPLVVYAGTGTGTLIGDGFVGAGMLKSLDGGTSWQLVATAPFAGTGVSAITVDPADPDVLLAAADFNTCCQFDHLPSAAPSLGLYKSSDGGTNWTLKLAGHVTDVEMHPTDFSRQYAGVGDSVVYPPNSTNAVYRTFDRGETWQAVTGPWSSMTDHVGRIQLAIAPSDPNTLYVSIQQNHNFSTECLGLWKTSNAWLPLVSPIWTQIPVPTPVDFCVGTPDQETIVDPADSAVLYAGGLYLYRYNGTSWTDITDTIHVDQHALAWAGSRLVLGNDGGVFSTPNGGGSWTRHNRGLQITQFYYGSAHPTNPGVALGGNQDNGTALWTGTDDWTQVLGGDGMSSAFAGINPDNRWAASFQNLFILRTTDGGASFDYASGGIESNRPFYTVFAKCPASDEVFIAATDNIWRTDDFFSAATPTWVANSSDFSPAGFLASIPGLAFAPSDVTCNTYAFGTRDGELRVTTTGGTAWTNLDPANQVPDRYVTDLAFDPLNANILYVTLSSFDEMTPGRPGHVFKTANALSGAPTWLNVTPLGADLPHNAVLIDGTRVLVGTDAGVWESANGGTTWTNFGPARGMPNVPVFDLAANPGGPIAFTHGRGAFQLVVAP